VNHIMFRCVFIRYVWVVIKETFGWDSYPKSLEDFVANWMGGGSGRDKTILIWFGCDMLHALES
jgi:hypothetical protein